MAKSKQQLAPWEEPTAAAWLKSFGPWRLTLKLIHGTLQLEPKTNAQEIRAATSLVILLCRENLWPADNADDLEKILELAARQLSTIKQLYETKARNDSALLSSKNYRNLLTSIDQEIRILEARMSDPKPPMPNEPPCTWGKFWVD